jgi:ABC-2 type transport system permease protein
MSRVLLIAQTELMALVRTKFFLASLILMPLLVIGLVTFLEYAGDSVDQDDRRFAVIDGTGELYDAIASAAAERNRGVGEGDARSGPHFLPERVDGTAGDAALLEQSERVRRREIFAFVDIPANVLAPEAPAQIRYYSEQTAYAPLSRWLRTTLESEIVRRRFETAGIDQALVRRLTGKPDLAEFGLVERDAAGGVSVAREVDELEQFGVPFFFLILMFMAVMTNAQHLINSIVEEKMSKISEVLLGSVTASQLLAGKLLGVVGVSLLLSLLYLAGGIYSLLSFGRPDLVDPALIGWFLVFLVCASLLYGSIFLALSSACSDLKDAQSMLQPAMFLVIIAYVVSFLVLRAPDSTMAVALSFVPTVTPFAMILRLAMPPGPPVWQLALSVVLLVGATGVVVWAAGRIFRVGLLMQGKPPNLPELLRWIRA